MRPPAKQQAPTSFIRRWPRGRRDLRGPQEYCEVFAYGGAPSMDQEPIIELAKMALAEKKPGWGMERLAVYSSNGVVYTKVRYFRLPKEGSCRQK